MTLWIGGKDDVLHGVAHEKHAISLSMPSLTSVLPAPLDRQKTNKQEPAAAAAQPAAPAGPIIIVLVGPPGAGKSRWTESLRQQSRLDWRRVNQVHFTLKQKSTDASFMQQNAFCGGVQHAAVDHKRSAQCRTLWLAASAAPGSSVWMQRKRLWLLVRNPLLDAQ